MSVEIFTYKQNGTTLKEVFNEIYKQSGYNILWEPKGIKNTQVLDVNFKLRQGVEGGSVVVLTPLILII